ncbi:MULTISPECIES: hypothetical protein [Ensifer]|jgi:hypothetical protein|uniref:Uncharacterized protein n=1 Tax=Ensifer canadensis TaxID=555315 RepID=A0AAW4FVY7_9HYPH|nr:MULTISPECIES: hypothetical protein [Ensifer]KQU94566.1 hypothetical protein ASD00_21880 [Ensifer sp. Root31]KQW61293.1 hypothetical protein ASD02_22480 [Ensifer sp. Root1252]KQW82760.1 hypothetical protein ASD03_22660 [Ensifer sp. Root127]KRC59931.1 hypothetical protein ASE32_12780 [Ensifer sp. Root231]KRD01285.1 hypothetical protein ASE47_23080 [Ensifer sp. Root258]
MFYLGGMTLGYLEPPAPKAVVQSVKPRIELTPHEPADDRERERDQEWARAFLTPWHLFY